MKRLMALALCALLVVGCGAPAAAAPAKREDFDAAYFAEMAGKEGELRELLDACALAGIPADYEEAAYNTFRVQLRRFDPLLATFPWYALEDSLYNDKCLNDIYNETKASLLALLAGEKEGVAVPKFVLGDVRIEGQSLIAQTTAGERPVFFTGFGAELGAGNDAHEFSTMGMNLVQQNLGPVQIVEPADGEKEYEVNPDDADLLRIVDVCQRADEADVWVDLLLQACHFPGFLLDNHPELKMDNGPHGFIKFDIAAPLVREVMAEFIEVLLDAVKDFDSLRSICLVNEPVFQSWKSPAHLEPWREFARERYGGDIGALNKNCGTGFKSFGEIPFPDIKASALMVDFIDYNDSVMDDFHEFLIGEIRKHLGEGFPVHTKLMDYYSTGKWEKEFGEKPFMRGADHEKIAGYTQINGCDAWRTLPKEWNDPLDQAFDPVRYLSKNMWYDLLRSASNAPAFNSEDHFTNDDDPRILPESVPLAASDIWMGAVHGRAMSSIWVWEFQWPGTMLYHSVGWRADMVAAIGRANLDLNRLAYEVTALQNAPADVAVLYSKSSCVFDYTNVMETTYDAYQFATLSGQRVDFVTENDIADKLDTYEMLILPKASRMPKKAIEAIKAFQNNGGAVVVIGLDSLWFDEYGRFGTHLWDMLSIYWNAAKIMPSLNIFGISLSFAKFLQQCSFQRVLNKTGLYNLGLTDLKTGRPVMETEWFGTEYDGGTIINMCNYDWKSTPTVKVTIGDMEYGTLVDLITGEEFKGSVKLEPFTPRLLAVSDPRPAQRERMP